MEAASEISPATTEISLSNGDHDSEVSQSEDTSHAPPTVTPGLPNTAIGVNGSQSYGGSSNVGSRLAGESAVGSRLASANITTHTQSTTDPNQSPMYKNNLSFSGSKHNIGYGNPTGLKQPVKTMTLQEVQQAAAVKAENLKTWSVKTYKCTKQLLSEKLGKGTKTVDLELEAKIEILRDTKRKYENLLMLTKALSNHFSSIVQTQKVLGEAFSELSAKSQELQDEFRFNAETQHVLVKNGETLLSAVNFFIGGLTTLCSKTMDDSLLTVSRYESARVEFDAYRSELEYYNLAPRTEANIARLTTAQSNFNKNKEIYDKLRSDVGVKLQFLDENRIKVMQKNLLLFHNAITAYFAGNQQKLEATVSQFNVKPAITSWVERN